MLLAGRSPSEVALSEEVSFEEEHTARREAVAHLIHPRSVEIVEHQDCIEAAEVRPGTLEIDVPEIDGETQLLSGGSGRGQLVRVTIEGDDQTPGAGGGETVPPFTACNVEHP